MNETELLAAVVDLCDGLGLLWHHTPDSRRALGSPGFPDLVIAGPNGLLFAELKSGDGETSANQQMWAWTLYQVGRTVRLWRPVDLEDGRISQELETIALSHARAIASGRHS